MENDIEKSYVNQRANGIKIPTPWGTFEVRGLGTILTLSLIALCLIAYMTWEGKSEHDKIVSSILQVNETMNEQTYVLSLSTEERANLRITMPASLRAKISKNEQ